MSIDTSRAADPTISDLTRAECWGIEESEIPTDPHHAPKLMDGSKRRLLKHINLVTLLPEPGTVFRAHDLGVDGHSLRHVVSSNIIVQVGRAPSPAETGNYVNAYAINPKAHELILSHAEREDTLPCCFAGKGFSNAREAPEEWVICSDCGAGHRKDLVREVLL